jgi:hypothetical protein
MRTEYQIDRYPRLSNECSHRPSLWALALAMAIAQGCASSPPDVRHPDELGCFAARLTNGSTGFDFMLAAFHARWEGGNTGAIKNEVRNIPQVFQAMRQARPGEEDLIIVGDFNLVKANLEDALGGPVLTVGSGSTLNTSGGELPTSTTTCWYSAKVRLSDLPPIGVPVVFCVESWLQG